MKGTLMSFAGTKDFPNNLTVKRTLAAAVAVNDVVDIGGSWAISSGTYGANEEGVYYTRGQFIKPKVPSQAFAAGDALWWDETNNQLTNVPQKKGQVGRCAKDAAAATTVAEFDINERSVHRVRHTVTSAEAGLNVVTFPTGTGQAPTGFVSVVVLSAATPSVPRMPTSINFADAGGIQVIDTGLAENEVIMIQFEP